MARLPKPLETTDRRVHRSSIEIEARKTLEEMFSGDYEKGLKPSNRLNANQKKLFKQIADHYTKLNIAGDIDFIMLENTVVAIDRLQNIEKMINQDFEMIRDRELMQAKDKYTKDLFKGSEKFGLSPIDRAKFALATGKKVAEENDPLLSVLKNKSS